MRVLGVALRVVGIAAVFVASLLVGFLLHLGVPATQRAVLARVNATLAPVFAGTLTIDGIMSLGATHLGGVEAHVVDAKGQLVVRASGIGGRVDTGALVRSLWPFLHKRGPVVVRVPVASVASAEVFLDGDESGSLRVARAFQPREPSVGPPGPGARVSIEQAHIAHLTVRGQPPGAPRLDADLDDADGSLHVEPDRIHVDVAHTRWVVRGLAGGPDARGDAEGHLTLPSDEGHDLGLHVIARGAVGAVAAQVDAAYDGGQVDAVVEVPVAKPDEVRSLLPSWPVTAPLSVHAEAHGELPTLAARVHATAASSTLDVDGPVTVVPALGASLHVNLQRIDAHAIDPQAPATDLTARGEVSVATKPAGALEARAELEIDAGKVARVRTPSIAVTAEATQAPDGAIHGSAKAWIHQPGAPTVVTAHLESKKKSLVASFQAAANVTDLAAIAQLRGAAKGHALAQLDGRIDFVADSLDARLRVAGEDLEAAGAKAEAAQAEIHAMGPLEAPSFDVVVATENLAVWRLECSTASAAGRLFFDSRRGSVRVEDVDVRTRASDQGARARVRLVEIADDALRIEDADVRGFGAPVQATVRYSPGKLFVNARSGEIDLERVARVIRVAGVEAGKVSFDVDATIGHGAAEGRVTFDSKDASLAGFEHADAHVEATLEGKKAAGHVTAQVPDVGSIDVQSSSIQVGPAGPLHLSSWRRAWGVIDAKAHLDLAHLYTHVPEHSLPFSRVGGVVDAAVRIDRDSPEDESPGVEATVATTGLLLGGGEGPSAWRLEGIDPKLHASVDSESGATQVDLDVHDATGTILDVGAQSSAVPYGPLATGDGLLDALLAMPFDARINVPSRELDSLPPSLVSGMHGLLAARVEWHGALRKPTVQVDATLGRGHEPSVSSLPVDVAVALHYDGDKFRGTVTGLSREKAVLEVTGNGQLHAPDAVEALVHQGTPLPWTAAVRALLDGFPLRSFTWLSDRQVRGKATGNLVIEGLHDDAHATASLTVDGFAVGDVECKAASVDATVDGHTFEVKAHIDHADGGADLQARGAAHWGKALAPSLDTSQAAEASLVARRLRAALLLPFVIGPVSALDGRVDANVGVAVDPGANAIHPQGKLELSDGTFELVSVGGEFAGVSGKVTLAPDGLIQLEDFVAHGITGKLEAAASARIEGLKFVGARATVQIAPASPIPVVFDGVQLGVLDGHLDVEVAPPPNGRGLYVTVSAPTLHMALPETGTHDVQQLGPLEGVATGVLGDQGFVDVPIDAVVASGVGGPPPAPIQITLKLGNDVRVGRGSDVDVRLQGEPVVTIAEDVRVTGQIRVTRGTINVQGKPFNIEKGTITFGGDDPSNPQVVLTAEWTAPDQTKVYADFVGPLKTGKVTLRSDPVLPGGQNDILSLILFGQTQSEVSANPNQQPIAGAAGAAGGVAAAPINQALGGVNRALDKFGVVGGISAGVDTTGTTPMPEVSFMIARDISVKVAQVVTQTISTLDTTFVTLNWRFARKWSIETTAGNRGTSIVDLIWQHRY
jgi:translocation and assembly module TamB